MFPESLRFHIFEYLTSKNPPLFHDKIDLNYDKAGLELPFSISAICYVMYIYC
jgi:hypothetical protein